jgi:hypothetical protein
VNKLVKTIGILIGGLVLAALGLFAFAYTQIPPLQAQLPQNTLIVTIVEPSSGMVLLQGGPYTVRAEVVGPAEVAQVELWADGKLVGSSDAAPTGGYSSLAKWDWTITSPGQHSLFARALDTEGQVAVSTPILLTAVQMDTGVEIRTVLASEGDTLSSVAAANDIPTEAVLAYNDIADPDEPLETGKPVYLPVGQPGSIPPDQPAGPDPQSAPAPAEENLSDASELNNPYLLWLSGLLNSGNTIPTAPLLSAEVLGCRPTLYIGDQSENELGFLVYRYQANLGQWMLIDALGSHKGTGTLLAAVESDLSENGTLFLVEAFNSQGKAASIPVLAVPKDASNCQQATADQGIQILNGVLIVSPVYQNVYLYLSLGNGQFQRIPEDKNTFLPAVQNGYDLSPFVDDAYLPGPLGPSRADYEVWGWQNGGLTRIGNGGTAVAAGEDFPIPLSGGKLQISSLTPTFSDVSPGSDEAKISPDPWELDWFGLNLSDLQGRVQISLSPFPSTASLNPPGLLGEMEIENAGPFTIDFGEILHISQPVESGPLQQSPYSGSITINEQVVGSYPGGLEDANSPAQAVGQLGGQTGGLNTSQINLDALAPIPLDLYIRVVPLQNGKLAGEPTNMVIAHYIPPDPNADEFELAQPPFVNPIYQTKIVKYLPPDFADPNRWGCVVVTGYDESILVPGLFATNIIKNNYPIGMEKCPKSWSGDNKPTVGSVLGDIFNGFKSLFNFVTGLYNDIKAWAIEQVLLILPCEEFGAEKACEDAVNMAVNAGMAAVGLPPSLPDLDQFAAAAKGELVDVIVETTIEQSGVPCVDACEDLLHDAVEGIMDDALEQLTKTPVAPGCVSEHEAHQHGSEPWCPPPGLIVKPAPAAANQPASAVVEVSLVPGAVVPPDDPVCTILVRVQTEKYFQAQTWSGAGGYLKYPIEAQTVTMNPYLTELIHVSGLAPGETASFVIVFDKTSYNYYLPWTSDMYKNSQEVPSWTRDWFAAVRGADATLFTAVPDGYGTNCAIPDQVQFTMP